MAPPPTPEQAKAAERIRGMLSIDARHRPGAGSDRLYRLFAAAVINQTLTNAQSAFRSCDEGQAPTLPDPTLIVITDAADDDPDAAADDVFASEWIVAVGSGAAGPDRGEAALWFRTRVQALSAVVGLAADAGFDQQCWQLAAYCTASMMAEGALAEAAAVGATGLAAARRCRDERAVAIMHLECGAAAKLAGRLTDAMDHYNVAMPIMQRLDDVIGQANTLLRRGAVHMRRLELQEARDCQLEALTITSIPALTALATANMGSIALKAGELSEAIQCSHAALQIIEGACIPAVRQVMEANRDLAEAYLALGDLPAARQHVDAALAAAEATRHDMSFAYVQVAVYRTSGQVALAEGKHAIALREFTRALTVRSGSTVLMADLLEDIALAALTGPDRPTGLAVLHAALAQRRVDGVAFRTASTMAHLATAYQDQDDTLATELRAEAIAQLSPLADAPSVKLRERLATAA